jgi:hypothetical protein
MLPLFVADSLLQVTNKLNFVPMSEIRNATGAPLGPNAPRLQDRQSYAAQHTAAAGIPRRVPQAQTTLALQMGISRDMGTPTPNFGPTPLDFTYTSPPFDYQTYLQRRQPERVQRPQFRSKVYRAD